MTSNGFYHKKARRPERFFTLIEMLAAMAVLSILMLMLFQFFGSAQKAWSSTEANAEVFENARVIFDIVQRDLQGAVARLNDIPDQNIAFNWASTPSSDAHLWLVSAGADDGSLNEVGYQWTTTGTADAYTLRRASVDVTHGADPYVARRDPPGATGYQPVADGVINFVLSCSPISYTAGEKPTLPDAVMVQMTLLDKKSFDLWTRLTGAPKADLATRKARTFSKVILLGSRQ